MARYNFHLHQRPTTSAVEECADLDHDEDAIDLARVILLSTRTYSRAEVYRGETLVGACHRDGE